MISDIKVGDSVLAADEMGLLQFSQVIMKAHDDPELTNRFQIIRTKMGRNLTLTDYGSSNMYNSLRLSASIMIYRFR